MRYFALYVACLLANISSVCWTSVSQAQVIPDKTLGTESSVVTTDIQLQGAQTDLIEGGATRGANLFHSFSEFNVLPDQRVYFANPADIDSILSRVTGANPSDIFGTLGVDGSANLFLINPNGIVFGPDVSLDIEGSFYATTAESVEVGEGVFSAIAPEQSQLLAISPSVSFWNYLTERSGDVVNRGQVSVGGELVLAGNTLDLEAQVAAVEDVSLLATDTVKVRDTSETSFIGFAGGNLLVQGNEQVDIVALNHPDSGLFSYGDMVLRSAGPIRGDIHYTSGGSFQIEDLANEPGTLLSPIDPIIRTLGDVTIGRYEGVSLHILAGGSVTIGTAEITAPETTTPGVDFLQEAVTLADGTVVNVDGSAQPTLDVRAGIESSAIGVPPSPLITGLNNITDIFTPPLTPPTSTTPTDSDITIGDIALRSPNGLVLLTNQYQPNTSLDNGNITVTGEGDLGFGIDARNLFAQGGSVFLDSRNNIEVINSGIETTSTGEVGDIVLIADNEVIFEGFNSTFNQPSVARASLQVFGLGTGGNVKITAQNLEVLDGAQLIASSAGIGDSGNIILNIQDTARFEGRAPSRFTSVAISAIEPGGQGTGGNLEIIAGNLEVLNGAQIGTAVAGQGAAGDVVLDIQDIVKIVGIDPIDGNPSAILGSILPGAQGSGGNIEISANTLEVLDGGLIDATTAGNGDTGNITLDIRGAVRIEGANRADQTPTGIVNDVISDFQRSGGNIEITANTLEILNGAKVRTLVFPNQSGTAGNVNLDIRDTIIVDGFNTVAEESSVISSALYRNSQGQGGNVNITATNLQVLNGAQLTAATFGDGDAGSLTLNITARALVDDANSPGVTTIASSVEPGARGNAGNVNISANELQVINVGTLRASTSGQGNAGNVEVTANTLDVLNGGQLSASTFADGEAGDVILTIAETVRIDGDSLTFDQPTSVGSTVEANAQGNGGDVKIIATNLEVMNGGNVSTIVAGDGNGGDVVLSIRDTARFEGVAPPDGQPSGISSSIQPGGDGDGGDIEITAGNLEVLEGAQIFSATFSDGDAGDITLAITETARFEGTDRLTDSRPSTAATSVGINGRGDGGDLTITANNLDVLNGAQLISGSVGNGDAGDVILNVTDTARFEGPNPANTSTSGVGSDVFAEGRGTAGDIVLNATNLLLKGGTFLSTTNLGQGNTGNIELVIQDRLEAIDGNIATQSESSSGGEIKISSGSIFLSGDSDITTFVSSGAGRGGNITIVTDNLTAFDDSDILAFSLDGRGGDVDLSQTAFFGQRFEPAPRGTDPRTLDNNNRVDINAAGQIASGTIDLLDISFIENSLTELPDELVNTETLVTNSCISRSIDTASSLTISNNDGLPQQPDTPQVNYSLGTVQTVPMADELEINSVILEPQKIYQLANGHVVMSRDCQSKSDSLELFQQF